MITQTAAIARTTFIESLRQPVVLFMVMLCAVAQVLTTWGTGFAMGLEESSEVEGDNKLLFDIGLSSVFICGTILAAFIATAALSREIENKTALTIVSKPVSRPTVILGKYLGVSAALAIAASIMGLFLLIAIRHGVLTTAADDIDQPVIIFSLAAVSLAFLLAAWCNFFYGWNFPQVATLLLLPFTFIAYILILKVSKKWAIQDFHIDLKPQVTLATIVLLLAMFVLSSVAVAASARLSQVMTIFVCLGVFLASLLSNFFVGRFAFSNSPIGQITAAAPLDQDSESFNAPGQRYSIELRKPPDRALKPGDSIYFGVNNNGFDLLVPSFPPFNGKLDRSEDTLGPNAVPALVAETVSGKSITLRLLGTEPLHIVRPPLIDDYVFTKPTSTNYLAMGIWGAFPNVQFFWLLDAVSQNQIVPLEYLAVMLLYAIVQIGIFLSLAIILFQKRDVA